MLSLFRRNKEIIALVLICIPLFFVKNWEGSPRRDALHYSAVSKNIVTTNEWVLLQDQPGVLYGKKPPLMFWMIASFYTLFGVSFGVAKSVAGLLTVGLAVSVFLLARRLFDKDTGLLAGFMVVTCLQAVDTYGSVTLESAVTLSVVLSVYAIVRAVQDERPRWLLLIGIAAGLGTMVKPIALLHVFAISIIALLCMKRKWLWHPCFLVSILITGAIVLPWHLVAISVGGDEFVQVYFAQEMGERMEVGGHILMGLAENLQSLLIGTLPWMPLCLVALWPWRKRWEKLPKELNLFFALWIIEVLVTMAWPEKRYNRYTLLAHPALVIPGAWMAVNWMSTMAREKAARRIAYLAVAASVVMMAWPAPLHKWTGMEFVKGRHYLDEFMPGAPAAYFDPDYESGLSTTDSQWPVRSSSVYFLDRSVETYQTVAELNELRVPFVFARNLHADELLAQDWKRVLVEEEHIGLYQNPFLVESIEHEDYEERIQSIRLRIQEMGEYPTL